MNNFNLLLATSTVGDYLEELLTTLKITLFSTAISYLLGVFIAIALYYTKKGGLKQNRVINVILDFVINLLRSVPFVILLVLTQPIAKAIVGTKMGNNAFIVYLTISATPFVARLCESSFNEVNSGIIESAVSMGASHGQIIFKVLFPESKPSLILGGAIAFTTILGYTPMSYLIGGGGLGSMAVNFGLLKIDKTSMIIASLVLVLLVQVVQFCFSKIAQKLDKRKKV